MAYLQKNQKSDSQKLVSRDDATTQRKSTILVLILTQKRCVVAASREAKCLVSDGRLQPANQKGNVKGWFHATTRGRNENLQSWS
jgi:hypothetical protein